MRLEPEMTNAPADWLFDDPPNTAAMTTSFVLDGSPILRVFHDYDGGWQFHGLPDEPATEDVARVVSLRAMVELDPSVSQVHDLQLGWRAVRSSIDAPWVRENSNPFPEFAENGYYLEDAVWIAQFRDDLNPPGEDVRENLSVGDYAKLLFRFADEGATRADGQTERMWVKVTGFDDDGYYVGTLENDSHLPRPVAKGDTVHFHPINIAEV